MEWCVYGVVRTMLILNRYAGYITLARLPQPQHLMSIMHESKTGTLRISVNQSAQDDDDDMSVCVSYVNNRTYSEYESTYPAEKIKRWHKLFSFDISLVKELLGRTPVITEHDAHVRLEYSVDIIGRTYEVSIDVPRKEYVGDAELHREIKVLRQKIADMEKYLPVVANHIFMPDNGHMYDTYIAMGVDLNDAYVAERIANSVYARLAINAYYVVDEVYSMLKRLIELGFASNPRRSAVDRTRLVTYVTTVVWSSRLWIKRHKTAGPCELHEIGGRIDTCCKLVKLCVDNCGLDAAQYTDVLIAASGGAARVIADKPPDEMGVNPTELLTVVLSSDLPKNVPGELSGKTAREHVQQQMKQYQRSSPYRHNQTWLGAWEQVLDLINRH